MTFCLPVRRDAAVELEEAVTELADGTGGEVAHVTCRKAGVFTADPAPRPTNAAIIADEDFGSGDEAGREGLVVRVSDADDPCVVD